VLLQRPLTSHGITVESVLEPPASSVKPAEAAGRRFDPRASAASARGSARLVRAVPGHSVRLYRQSFVIPQPRHTILVEPASAPTRAQQSAVAPYASPWEANFAALALKPPIRLRVLHPSAADPIAGHPLLTANGAEVSQRALLFGRIEYEHANASWRRRPVPTGHCLRTACPIGQAGRRCSSTPATTSSRGFRLVADAGHTPLECLDLDAGNARCAGGDLYAHPVQWPRASVEHRFLLIRSSAATARLLRMHCDTRPAGVPAPFGRGTVGECAMQGRLDFDFLEGTKMTVGQADRRPLCAC